MGYDRLPAFCRVGAPRAEQWLALGLRDQYVDCVCWRYNSKHYYVVFIVLVLMPCGSSGCSLDMVAGSSQGFPEYA